MRFVVDDQVEGHESPPTFKCVYDLMYEDGVAEVGVEALNIRDDRCTPVGVGPHRLVVPLSLVARGGASAGRGANATVLGRQMVLHRHIDGALLRMRIVGFPNLKKTPSHWTPQLVEDEAHIVTVPAGTAEWEYVASALQLRAPPFIVTAVQRIQDVDLWERYDLQLQQRASENAGDANERWLFHGTQTTDPKVIWHDGDVGMDNRFSSKGYYGRGSYFSESAHYSDGYAHNDPSSGHKQMFLVSVVCGASKDYGTSDGRDLTRPPAIPGGNGRIFASVNGHHGNSPDCRMFVTYHNDQAYPRYLVTYHNDLACPRYLGRQVSTNPGDRSSSAQSALKQLGCEASLVDQGLAPPPPSFPEWAEPGMSSSGALGAPLRWLWEWEDGAAGSGQWKKYSVAESAKIEGVHMGQLGQKCTITNSHGTYEIDPVALKQTKMGSSFERKVRRVYV